MRRAIANVLPQAHGPGMVELFFGSEIANGTEVTAGCRMTAAEARLFLKELAAAVARIDEVEARLASIGREG